MMQEKPKSRLGRGLDALFAEEEVYTPSAVEGNFSNNQQENNPANGLTLMPIEFIRPGAFQPRHYFNEDALNDLAQSIKEHGVLQPLLIRPITDEVDQFEIIAGERRWRAAQKAQLHEVPVIIQEFSDTAALEIGLIENLQREDLNAIEEALGYRRLIDQFEYTQEKLADKIGKSRSYVTNSLRLLKLPEDVQKFVEDQKISVGHARALVGSNDPSGLSHRVIKEGLSVRDLERFLSKSSSDDQKTPSKTIKKPSSGKKPVEITRLEDEMTNILGLKVTIDGAGQKGQVTLHYTDLDQMDMLLRKLSQ